MSGRLIAVLTAWHTVHVNQRAHTPLVHPSQHLFQVRQLRVVDVRLVASCRDHGPESERDADMVDPD